MANFETPKSVQFYFPGQGDVSDAVSQALLWPLAPHGGEVSKALRVELSELWQKAFKTSNSITCALALSGSGAADVCIKALLHRSSQVMSLVQGVFSERMYTVASSISTYVTKVDIPWGNSICLEKLEKQLRKHSHLDLLMLVHGETSTGVINNVKAISTLVKSIHPECLILLDAVSTGGRVPLCVDDWKLDAVYCAGQKGIGAYAGVSGITLSDRAFQVFTSNARGELYRPQSWLLDLTKLLNFWLEGGSYHVTPPIPLLYALKVALEQLVTGEGMEALWGKQARAHHAFAAAIEAMGLSLPVAQDDRLPTVVVIKMPAGIDAVSVVSALNKNYNIVVSTAMGPWQQSAIRVGLFGPAYKDDRLHLMVTALGETLSKQGATVDLTAAIDTLKTLLSDQTTQLLNESRISTG